ncbi:hypothetical protein OHB54_38840 [Streptomyces sp. NBC_01007]|nr:hypothetical protein OHB54_38840 [Streptomyces sp. NBC_01007]
MAGAAGPVDAIYAPIPSGRLDGHAYGFGTDGASGGFADTLRWKVLSGKIRRHYEEGDESAAEFVTDGCLRATDVETGGDLVSFCTEGEGIWRSGWAATSPANWSWSR